MPPDAETVAEPVGWPQRALLTDVVVRFSCGGWVIVTVAVAAQKLASVTVTVYEPAVKLVAVCVVCPLLH